MIIAHVEQKNLNLEEGEEELMMICEKLPIIYIFLIIYEYI